MAAASHAGQHLGRMEGAHARALALELAGHVHQATEVATEQQARAAAVDRAGLLADDRVRDRRVLDAEGAAETAAHIVTLERLQREPGHLAQQGARLVMDTELAQAGATVVVGEAGGRASRRRAQSASRRPEAHEFVGAFAEPARAFGPGGIVCQGLGVVHPLHAGRTSRKATRRSRSPRKSR